MKWMMLVLIISNGFFVFQTYFWQKRAVSQIITTSDVEQLFKQSGCEIGSEDVKVLNTEISGYAKIYDLSQDTQEFYSQGKDYTAYSVGGGQTLYSNGVRMLAAECKMCRRWGHG